MSYIRKKKFEDRVYYYEVEGYRDDTGRVRQRVLRYLGKSPNKIEMPVEPAVASQLAEALMSRSLSTDDVKMVLEKLGIPVKGRLKQVNLCYKPPLRKLTLRIE